MTAFDMRDENPNTLEFSHQHVERHQIRLFEVAVKHNVAFLHCFIHDKTFRNGEQRICDGIEHFCRHASNQIFFFLVLPSRAHHYQFRAGLFCIFQDGIFRNALDHLASILHRRKDFRGHYLLQAFFKLRHLPMRLDFFS